MKLQKETESSEGRHGRWYEDACGTAFAMELIGERWSLLVVRELMLGGRRFSELRKALNGISAKVLTERLESLERAGAVTRRMLPPPANVQVYELTEWGYLAEPAIQELGRWAATSPRHDPTLPLSPVSLMLSFRTMLDKVRAKEFDATIGFDIAGESYRAELKDGRLPIRRDDIGDAQVTFRAPAAPLLAAVFYGKVPPEELAGQGIRIDGDRALAERFVDLFHLPAKVG
jgi:DNA-binding HxlR family transcriptional regulator